MHRLQIDDSDYATLATALHTLIDRNTELLRDQSLPSDQRRTLQMQNHEAVHLLQNEFTAAYPLF